MVLVDKLFLKDSQDERSLAEAIEKFQNESRTARHRRQEAVKLKDVKCLAFGKYVTLVPSFNLSRHYDRPLPSSYATYKGALTNESITMSKYYIPGQQFFGVIVPRTEAQMLEYETELPRLEELRVSVDRCVQAILEAENCQLLKRLKLASFSFEERNMPASVGYEMISLENKIDETNKLSGDSAEIERKDTDLSQTPSSSLKLASEMDQVSHTILCASGQQSSSITPAIEHNGDSAMAATFQLTDVTVSQQDELAGQIDQGDETARPTLLTAPDQPTLSNVQLQFLDDNKCKVVDDNSGFVQVNEMGDRKLAIVQTCEERRRSSLFKQEEVAPGDALSTDILRIEDPLPDDATEEPLEGVEVILEPEGSEEGSMADELSVSIISIRPNDQLEH